MLGYKWRKKEDTFRPRWKIHLGEVKRGVKCGVVLTMENYEQEINRLFSKKMLLSVIAQLYDPIGFFTPLVLNLRNLLSILHQETKGQLDEDADIPGLYKIKLQWMIKEILLASQEVFPRQ